MHFAAALRDHPGVTTHRDRFTYTVEDYRRYRPDYPEAMFDWLLAELGLVAGDAIIDIGCGTGITSRAWAARGLEVVGVDPNAAMLAAARAEGGGPTYVPTDAETLAVPERDYAAIVGGQSFHWIDLDRAGSRFRAVLGPARRPGRLQVGAFWNLRTTDTLFMRAYDGLLRQWSPEYAEVGAESRALVVASHVGGVQASFAHHQALDRRGLLGRAWSSSYIRNVVEDREGFDRALVEAFETYEEGGFIRFAYRTLAVAYSP